MTRYEIGVYNKLVRELVQMGDSHKNLDDSWADIHYVDVTAESESDARLKVSRRYPERDGYIIESVLADKFA